MRASPSPFLWRDMAGHKGSGAGGNNQHPDDGSGIRVRTMKSKVVGEFVDAIPEIDPKDNFKGKMQSFQRQEGLTEALNKAFNAPGRAMILVDYNLEENSKSRRRALSEKRVEYLNDQGYSEQAGWIVRAVDGRVYVLYQGVM